MRQWHQWFVPPVSFAGCLKRFSASIEYDSVHRVASAPFSLQLLQRLLDDRRPTVQMIQAEGERIAATADTQDRDKIQSQLQNLGERWTELLDKASGR